MAFVRDGDQGCTSVTTSLSTPPLTPAVTVVVPVFNGDATIRQCLKALFSSTLANFEVIVIDDGSTDSTVEIARSFPCQVLVRSSNAGPATARNHGARLAKAEILYFLDADIVVKPETLSDVVQALHDRPEVCAVFGSFGKETVPQNFVSVYKNLLHHYTHQNSNPDATAFCGGFSAIRTRVFLDNGGFNPKQRFLEDVELGYRLRRAGHRIWLKRDIQVSHCKQYSLASLIRSDVAGRAIPWTRLMLGMRTYSRDLNTRIHHVLSLPVAFLLLGCLAYPPMWRLSLPFAILFVVMNRGFLTFTWRERGVRFALGSAAMCWLGCLYSGIGAGIGVLGHVRHALADMIPGRARSRDRIKDPL